MAIRAVQQQNEYVNNPYLTNVVRATTTGGLVGIASKYVLPLAKEEAAGLSNLKPFTKDAFISSLKIKHARATMPLVALGTGLGFFFGVAGNVLKTKAG